MQKVLCGAGVDVVSMEGCGRKAPIEGSLKETGWQWWREKGGGEFYPDITWRFIVNDNVYLACGYKGSMYYILFCPECLVRLGLRW